MLQMKWVQALMVFLATVLAWFAIGPNSPSPDVEYIGLIIGSAIGTFALGMLLAHIPAVIARLFTGRWPSWQIWLSVPVVAFLLYSAHVGYSTGTIGGQSASASTAEASEYWFSGDRCDLAARFPGRPELQTNSDPSGGQSREARYMTEDNFHLRAECAQHTGDRRSVDWAGIVEGFMAAQGLTNSYVSTKDIPSDESLSVVDGRGQKTIDGTGVTYMVRLVASDQSFMVLYLGGASDKFPSNYASTFLDRYRRQ